MNIRVTNDNQIVFEGSAGEWLFDEQFIVQYKRIEQSLGFITHKNTRL